MKTGERGQVSTEYLLIIGAVVLAVVAAGALFVGEFRGSVRQLAADIEDIFENGIHGTGTVEELREMPELPAIQTAREGGIVPFDREFAPKNTEEIVANRRAAYATEIAVASRAGAAVSGDFSFALIEMLRPAKTAVPSAPDRVEVDSPNPDEGDGPLQRLEKVRR